MRKVIAIAITDSQQSRLGLPSRVDHVVAGRTVLEHTVARLSRIKSASDVVLIYPPNQPPKLSPNTQASTIAAELHDKHTPMTISSRKWALNAWRGGLGSATCYDELLPASAILLAMQQHHADSALIVGGDWMLVDPQLCDRVIDLHLENPDEYLMTFSQAPPGLAGIVAARSFIETLAENNAGFNQILAYVPARPQADPIGRDVCVQIPPQVRSCARRFIYDTNRSAAMINAIADQLGDQLIEADALTVCQASRPDLGPPREFTLELTTSRPVNGQITPQHHVNLSRDPITLDDAKHIIHQVAQYDDAVLTLGGLGDALQHPQWPEIINIAHEAGVFGLCIETDLHGTQQDLDNLLSLPIDVISIRINADTTATYEKLMASQPGKFKDVMDNVQYLLQHRAQNNLPGIPWIVPRLIKTADTLKDMETFFERWLTYTGQAIIEPALNGCGLMPDYAPLSMAPPKRQPCQQLHRRMTIHADAQVPRCDQDWLAKAPVGNAIQTTLNDLWQKQKPLRDAHQQGNFNQLELCNGCKQWHRP